MNKVSVILPVFNAEKYLVQCLDSILNQTYRNLEIIIIDDGSTDSSGEICDAYAKQDGRIQVMHCDNAGVPTARNKALDIATGEWISFVDSDDYLEENLYEICIGKVKKSQADILMFENDIIGKKGKKESKKEKIIRDKDLLNQLQAAAITPLKIDKIGYTNLTYIWRNLYRRSLIEEHNIRFPVRAYGQDDKVFNVLCLGYTQSFHIIGQILYHYRIVPSSLSHGFVKERMEWDEAVYEAMFQIMNIKDIRISDIYLSVLYAFMVNNLWAACSRCFFHPDNEKTVKEQIRYVREVLAREPYKTSLHISKFKYLGGGGKLIKLCKLNRAGFMYILYRAKMQVKGNR